MAKRFLDFMPVVGTIVFYSIAYIACRKMLNKEINELETEAHGHRVLDEVIEKCKQQEKYPHKHDSN